MKIIPVSSFAVPHGGAVTWGTIFDTPAFQGIEKNLTPVSFPSLLMGNL